MMRVETHEGVAVLLLDRTSRANALSDAMVEALEDSIDGVFSNPSIHTLVLTSAGEDFCTGFDIEGIESAGDGEVLLRLIRVEAVISSLWHAPVQTVCFAPGRSWGAGGDLLVACDRRIVVPGASIRFPGAQFGIVLGTRRLAERIGAHAAEQVVAHARTVDAESAVQCGLVNEIRERAELDRIVAECAPPGVSRETLADLRAAVRPDRRDEDLLALVRSASKPGLRDRILKYRDSLRGARSRKTED
jgi:enoyl-CoA hydratase/carnithine racemase